jgi:hypothetical protein
MHETERDAVLPLFQQPLVSGKIVIGEIEEADITKLQDRGFLVSRVDRPTERGVTAAGFAPKALGPELELKVGEAPTLPQATPQPVDVFVVDTTGPLLEDWRKQLIAAGAELLEYLQAYRYLVRLRLAKLPTVNALPFVRQVRLYSTRDAIDPAILAPRGAGTRAVGGAPAATPEMCTFEILLHRAEDLPKLRRWLERQRVDIAYATGRKIRFFALRSSTVPGEAARRSEVSWVDEYRPPRLSNDRARHILGVDGSAQPVTAQTGKGQIVAVADTGLDKDHPDFKGRVVGLIARGRPGDPSDPHGHGTHVAGSIAGDGAASSGAIRGTAPEASLFFQSIMDANGDLSGLDPELADVFEEAYDAGARIHSNSWGAEAGSAYRVTSIEVDDYIYTHPDLLVVFAAGNAGAASNTLNSPRGFVDLQSLDAPATAKNTLTVGASRNDRTLERQLTWRAFRPVDFPDDPIASEAVTGDPEAMAAFSGRGPTNDTVRIKPDVVGPGTFIKSTRAATAPLDSFWIPPEPGDRYAFMGGTSMATPLVAGCAARVRQYFIEARGHTPSAALLKAALVNGARWMNGADAISSNPVAPNNDQGFGRVHMPSTIPSAAVSDMELLFADEWQNDNQALATLGDAYQFFFEATGSGELRVCLVWTDPPGRFVQNSLVLTLEHSASGTKWSGNQDRRAQLKGPDLANNVQIIRIDRPNSGQYTAQVTAQNILLRKSPRWGPQRFALVVSGGVVLPPGAGGGLGVLHAL